MPAALSEVPPQMRFTPILVLMLLVFRGVPAGAGDYYDGISAYNQGKFADAMAHWIGLANRGDAKAESSIGFLYYKGLGVPQNSAVAAQWFYRAAVQGQVEAQTFLGIMHLRGEGVPFNPVLSHMWCELAVSQGFDEALDCRETVTHMLTQNQLKESERLVVRFRKLHAQR